MLEELKGIRAELTTKPAPSQPQTKGIIAEFPAFLNKYGVVGLAIAFIMGSAVSNLVSSIVNNLIMPFITPLTGTGDWRGTILPGPIPLEIGQFAGALLDFIIISFVIFILMRQIQKTGLK